MPLQPTSTGYADNGGCRLYYEAFGSPKDPTLLLVCGLGMQSIRYDEAMLRVLLDRRLYVVRFDNRDTGLSSDFADAPVGPAGNAYSVSDMAADGIAVLDALGVDRAHVFGMSMGGMIVQRMATNHPDRLASVISVMSSTGEREYGQATPEATAALLQPMPTERDAAIAATAESGLVWATPAEADRGRIAAEAALAYDRAFRPDGVERQYLAIIAEGRRRAAELSAITTPMLVIHGTADTLIDQSGGRRTAELVPGARLEIIDGMGHDLAPKMSSTVFGLVADFVTATSA